MDPKNVTVTYLGNSATLANLLSVKLIQEQSLKVFPPIYNEADLPAEWLPIPKTIHQDPVDDGTVITLFGEVAIRLW